MEYYTAPRKNETVLYTVIWKDIQDILSEKGRNLTVYIVRYLLHKKRYI